MSTTAKIQNHLETIPAGTVITAKSLSELGNRNAVDIALMRLSKAGQLERVARGAYCKPWKSQWTGNPVVPGALELAQQLSTLKGEVIAPHGAVAVNRFQLSTQVPLKLVLLTTGRSKTVQLGWETVRFQHVAAQKLPVGDSLAGMAITALHYLRISNEATPENTAKILKALPLEERERLTEVTSRLPSWMIEVLHQAQGIHA